MPDIELRLSRHGPKKIATPTDEVLPYAAEEAFPVLTINHLMQLLFTVRALGPVI
jgi:hypothetical protein